MLDLTSITGLIFGALQLLALAAGVFAWVHAVRQRPDAFTAVDKLTKPIWLGILTLSLLAIFFTGFIRLLGLIGVVAICVYLVDVRPRVDEVQRPRW